MPQTPAYTWSQTDGAVVVVVTTKGFPRERVDVLVADVVLKVNFPPYLLIIDLLHPVDDDNATAVFEDGQVSITLPKVTKAPWEALTASGSKTELRDRRDVSLQAKEARERALAEAKREKRLEDGRLALRKQMALEESERRRLDDKKADEKATAEAEVFSALAKYSSPPAPAPPKEGSPPATAAAPQPVPTAAPAAKKAAAKPIFDPPTEAKKKPTVAAKAGAPAKKKEEEEEYVPPPRGVRKALISFTPRSFPTPMRESNSREEEDWLAKNKYKMKSNPAGQPSSDGTSIEERDPVWLKGKGDDFYRSGDFSSAISAYSAALSLDSTIVPCLSNRSACYMRVKALPECVQDCAAALALVPDTGDSKVIGMRLKLLARQGTALCQSGKFQEALACFQAAGALEAKDATFAIAAGTLSRFAELNTQKLRADELFKAGDYAAAIDALTGVLSREPRFVSALANRSAARLASDDIPGAIEDCAATLALLGFEEAHTPSAVDDTSLDCVPPKGSARHRTFLVTTLVRRATAACKQERYAEAVEDFGSALSLDPTNESLREDYGRAKARTAVAPSDFVTPSPPATV